MWGYCDQTQVRGRTVTLKVKFQQVTRSRSSLEPIESRLELANAVLALLTPLFPMLKGVRLLGVSLSRLNNEAQCEEAQLAFSLRV